MKLQKEKTNDNNDHCYDSTNWNFINSNYYNNNNCIQKEKESQ